MYLSAFMLDEHPYALVFCKTRVKFDFLFSDRFGRFSHRRPQAFCDTASRTMGCLVNSLVSNVAVSSLGSPDAHSIISARTVFCIGANTFDTTVGDPLRPILFTSSMPAAYLFQTFTLKRAARTMSSSDAKRISFAPSNMVTKQGNLLFNTCTPPSARRCNMISF